jgi:diaminohydroxyphosphoribosylaminopyrimidine deaminase/5-amino-6-(5-phosphoribosylamino)uracil reductase
MMKRALTLAQKGWGLTYPNPMVGAVIVKNGAIIGEGWHHGPGQPHAEVEAIRSCQESPSGATIYVTLEPCNHYGRTGPCSEAVIAAGIAEVKYAVADPNPTVRGGGGQRLIEAGVKVETGLLWREAWELNRGFFHLALTGRPWVILKAAMSLDGKISDSQGRSQWITSPGSRRLVHRYRAVSGAVLIGSGTALADNPSLTNRTAPPIRRQPLKVLLDSSLRLNLACNLVQEAPENLIVFCNHSAPAAKEKALSEKGVRVIRCSTAERPDPADVLVTLGRMGVQSVLIEGGRGIFTSLIEANLVDEYHLFYGPMLLGGDQATSLMGGDGLPLANAPRLTIKSIRRVDGDLWVRALKEGSEPQCLQALSKK